MKVDLRSDPPDLPFQRTAAPARVMVVDDDPFVRTVIADALGSAGILVKTYASGDEAVAAARSMQPDLVLLDLRMQGMDGRATAQALRREYADVRLIFLTADGDIGARDEIMRLGAAGIIAKTFDPAHVADELLQLLGRTPAASHGGQFEAVAAEFRHSLPPTMASIKDAWAEVRALGWQKTSAEAILSKAHMLAGAAGLFHLHSVGAAADRVEGMLREILKADLSPSAATLMRLETEICSLAQACRET